jgi:hypothetical protein
MLARRQAADIRRALGRFPAVALLGPRQAGKTTLARAIAAADPARHVFLDLERPSELAKLAEPELYFAGHADRCVVLDEVQRRPELFPVLRALIDADRRPGRFLVLGSASPELIRQSSETLAGRIAFVELTPFTQGEVGTAAGPRLWLRGGYPESFLAAGDETSFAWREAFIRAYLERDIPQLGLRVPAARLGRFWQMLAHVHGQLWNASRLAASLDLSAPTIGHYLDILVDTFMVRRLPPLLANLGKRLVKSPKVYLRDSGLLHALLGLGDTEALMGHPALGASWEGWAVEQVLAAAPSNWQASFYRTAAGAEVDLVLEPPGGAAPIAVEIKYSAAPKPARGFWAALQDLRCRRAWVLAPVTERYPLADNVDVLPPARLEEIFR